MIWFKHFSDMHEGRSINNLMDELGHTGLCFYLLQEMCAKKLEFSRQNPEETSTNFSFHIRKVRQNLRVSLAKLQHILSVSSANGLLSYKFTEDSLEISMPILLNLLDRDQKKARQTRATAATKPRLDKEKEVEKELELDKELENIKLPKRQKRPNLKLVKPEKELNAKIWEAYRQAYFVRYGFDPIRNASVNAKISQIAKRLGFDAPDIVTFFVKHPDSLYVKTLHAIGLCLRDAEGLATQWRKGRALTSTDIKNYEQAEGYNQIIRDINAGRV